MAADEEALSRYWATFVKADRLQKHMQQLSALRDLLSAERWAGQEKLACAVCAGCGGWEGRWGELRCGACSALRGGMGICGKGSERAGDNGVRRGIAGGSVDSEAVSARQSRHPDPTHALTLLVSAPAPAPVPCSSATAIVAYTTLSAAHPSFTPDVLQHTLDARGQYNGCDKKYVKEVTAHARDAWKQKAAAAAAAESAAAKAGKGGKGAAQAGPEVASGGSFFGWWSGKK